MPQITINVIGFEEAGKTSLVNRLIYNRFYDAYESTPGAWFNAKPLSGASEVPYRIWDIGGARRYYTELPHYYQKADIIVLVFDVTNPDSFRFVDDFFNRKRDFRRRPPIPSTTKYLLVGTKTDLNEKRQVSEAAAKAFALNHGFHAYLEVSAKTGAGLEEEGVLVLKLKEICRAFLSTTSFHHYAKLCQAHDAKSNMIALLKNYIHGDIACLRGGVGRFSSGHWNRHHIKAVRDIVKRMESNEDDHIDEVAAFNELARLNKRAGGSLSLRLDYIKTHLLASHACNLHTSLESPERHFSFIRA